MLNEEIKTNNTNTTTNDNDVVSPTSENLNTENQTTENAANTTNSINNQSSNSTTQGNNEKENEHLLNVEANKKHESLLKLPSYEEAVSFNSFVSNLEANGNNGANSSFYIQNNSFSNQPQQSLQEKPLHSIYPVHPSPQQLAIPPKSQEQNKRNSTYLQSTANAANVSLLEGQPSKPVNSSQSNASAPPPTSNTYTPTAPMAISPTTPPSNLQYPPAPQSSYPPSPMQAGLQGSYPPSPMPAGPQGSYPPPPMQAGPQVSYPPPPMQAGPQGLYPPPMQSQYVPFKKHRFDSKKPESATNQNYEVCYDGEYTDMNGVIIIGTGIIGSRKTEVKALARENIVKSSVGFSVVDIRGARILNGESKIVFDGTLGKIILVIPKHLAVVMEEYYCIGEVFSYRPNEIPVNEAVEKGLPVIRVVIKNTIGDVNIIEEEADVNVSSDSLNTKVKKLRKQYGKTWKNRKNRK